MFCCSRSQTREMKRNLFASDKSGTKGDYNKQRTMNKGVLNHGDVIVRRCCCRSFISYELTLSVSLGSITGFCVVVSFLTSCRRPRMATFDVTMPTKSGSRSRKALTNPAHFTPGSVSPENWTLRLLLFSPTMHDGKSPLMSYGTIFTINEHQTFSAKAAWKWWKMKVD